MRMTNSRLLRWYHSHADLILPGDPFKSLKNIHLMSTIPFGIRGFVEGTKRRKCIKVQRGSQNAFPEIAQHPRQIGYLK